MSKDRVRVALVGCGFVGSAGYLPVLCREASVSLVALCDINPVRIKRLMKNADGASAYSCVEQLLTAGLNLDLIVNATPVNVHDCITRSALQRGISVYSEKPVAPTYNVALELANLAKAKGAELLVAPDTTTTSWFQKFANIVDSGELGLVHSAYGQFIENFTIHSPIRAEWLLGPDAGALNDIGVYPLTELTGLLGPATGVYAMLTRSADFRRIENGETRPAKNDDIAHILLQFPGHVVASISVSTSSGVRQEYLLELRGTKALARIRGKQPKEVEVVSNNGDTARLAVNTKDDHWCSGAAEAARYIGGHAPRPPMSVEHALHVTELLEACRRASEGACACLVQSTFNVEELRRPYIGRQL